MTVDRWIFVAGTPRSGTTFVGKILSSGFYVDYIHEPFNPDCGIPGIDQKYLYLRPDDGTASPYESLIRGIFDYSLTLKTAYYPEDGYLKRFVKGVVGSRGPFYLRLSKLNPFATAAVIKDPIGCLLAEHLAMRFGVMPVVLIRHPVTFVASFCRLGWDADLAPIRVQSELVEDHFEGEEAFLGAVSADPVARAAALWRALNKVLLAQARANPDWPVITHERLSQQPVETFRDLYGKLGLAWSSRVERLIIRRTGKHNPVRARRGRVQDFSRNSAGLFLARAQELSPEQRKTVYDITRDVALTLYSEESYAV